MKQLAVACISLFFAIVFLENCRTATKTTSLNEQKTWEQVVWDRNSIILKIANKKKSVANGALLYKQYCSICHGQQGEGGIAPNLTDDYWLHGGNKLDIARTIVYGVPDKGMRPGQHLLTPIEVGEIVSFISSLRGTNPIDAKGPQGAKQ